MKLNEANTAHSSMTVIEVFAWLAKTCFHFPCPPRSIAFFVSLAPSFGAAAIAAKTFANRA